MTLSALAGPKEMQVSRVPKEPQIRVDNIATKTQLAKLVATRY